MVQSLTTRSPDGSTNAAPWQTMSESGMEDPTWAHQDYNDFDTYAAGDWSITAVGTSAVTQTAFDGGAILLSTSAGGTDALYLQRAVASHKLTAGKDAFFKFRGQLSDATACAFHAGFAIISATPAAAADRLLITKAAGATTLSLTSTVGGVSTTVALPTSIVLANATPFEIGIHVDRQGNVEAFFNPTTGSNPIAATNYRGPVAKLTVPGVTQALLSPSFGLLNAAAAIKTLTVDYFVAAVSR